MEDQDALRTIRSMRDRALEDVEGIKINLARLQADYDRGDNHDDTKHAIQTSKNRLETRTIEAEALSLAVSNFNLAPTKDAKLALTEVIRDGSEITLKFFNHDDQNLLKLTDDAANIQRFAIQVLVQTNYVFEDAQHRLEGLDK